MGCAGQEEALQKATLKDVEGLVQGMQKKMGGAKNTLKGAEELVVRHLLPKPIYTQQELQQELGKPLEEIFANNPSQLRCLAVAAENGGR
jgi:hypothetical protein